MICVSTASSSMHAAIAVPLVSWDCFGASVFNSALLSHHHIPSQAPTDPQCLSPTVVCTRTCLAVRFLLRSAGSRYHVLLTGMLLINAFMMQKSSDLSISYIFVHPKGRARNGPHPRAPGCCWQSCWLFYLKSFKNQSKDIFSAGST